MLGRTLASLDVRNPIEHTSGVKVGGLQASSASTVSIMTALYFDYLRDPDRVSVKPHASPVLHAIEYLLGTLCPRSATRCRRRWG
jgi:pyruvate dehydrogenase E1 component